MYRHIDNPSVLAKVIRLLLRVPYVVHAAMNRIPNPIQATGNKLEHLKELLGEEDYKRARFWLRMKLAITIATGLAASYATQQRWSTLTVATISANEVTLSAASSFSDSSNLLIIGVARMLLFDFLAVNFGLALRGSHDKTMLFANTRIQPMIGKKGRVGIYPYFFIRGGTFVTLSALIALGEPLWRAILMKIVATTILVVAILYFGGGFVTLLRELL